MVRNACAKALKQTREGLQSLKGSPRYEVPCLQAATTIALWLCASISKDLTTQGPLHHIRYQCMRQLQLLLVFFVVHPVFDRGV